MVTKNESYSVAGFSEDDNTCEDANTVGNTLALHVTSSLSEHLLHKLKERRENTEIEQICITVRNIAIDKNESTSKPS